MGVRGAESISKRFHGNVHGKVRVNFLAFFFTENPYFHAWCQIIQNCRYACSLEHWHFKSFGPCSKGFPKNLLGVTVLPKSLRCNGIPAKLLSMNSESNENVQLQGAKSCDLCGCRCPLLLAIGWLPTSSGKRMSGTSRYIPR